jgi:nucleotide-binding universal stress UspA family protein
LHQNQRNHYECNSVPRQFSGAGFFRPFAESFGARVELVHVVELTYYPAEMTYMSGEMANLEEVVEKKAHLQIETLASEMIPSKCRGEITVHTGVPFKEVASAPKELESDLIIISTHGHTGLKHLFMGSTTDRVVRIAPVRC